jgi:nucleoside-diphosphate-sugar epimerase
MVPLSAYDPRVSASVGVCAVTGASGYVGSRVAGRLAGAGWEVRALCRAQSRLEDRRLRRAPFTLGQAVDPAALAGVDALVHAAYDFRPTAWAEVERVNVEGTRRLLAAARGGGVRRIVCLSTVAAFPRARSMYGRAKLEIERAAAQADAVVVRPGLVWGEQGAAIFGALARAVRLLPVVPMPAPADLPLMLVHEDDLALFVLRLLEDWPAPPHGLYVVGSAQTLTFAQLLHSLAPPGGARPRVVSLPWRPVWLALRALERTGARLPFPSDRLLSLATADRNPRAHATARAERYGVEFRPYASARS